MLDGVAEQGFLDRVVQVIKDEFAELDAQPPQGADAPHTESLRSRVAAAIRRGRGLGMQSEQSLSTFAILQMLDEALLDEPYVARLLAEPLLDPDERMDVLADCLGDDGALAPAHSGANPHP